MGELNPGSTPRRWDPPGGIKAHNEKIHRESKFADDHKKLPFTFSKPAKGRKIEDFRCVECGRIFSASKNTVMCICPDCKKLTKAERISDDEMACLDGAPKSL
jgi:predicted Zn-ribbon and HTH transcriptional regulator